MTLLYFAWVREGLGKSAETLDPPGTVRTVRDLLAWLGERGPDYGRVLKDQDRLRVAINQTHVPFDAQVAPGDEVAIFPPVTGG